MARGRRYDDEPRLNIKKVIAFILAVTVIIISVVGVVKLVKQKGAEEKFAITTEYLTIYTDNKWGVINSKGEIVVPATYEDMIIIPNKSKAVFICSYDADYEAGTYKTKVVNEKNETIYSSYSNIEAIDNYDEQGKRWYDSNLLKYKKDGKYGLINIEGKSILSTEYDDIYSLKGVERSIIIEKDGKLGLVNSATGEIILEAKYDEIEAIGDAYENGYIVKDDSGLYGVIGPDKKVILENKYEGIKNVCGSSTFVEVVGDANNIIDSKGTRVLENVGDVSSINGSNIVVKKDDKFGIIGIDGSEKIPFQYDKLTYTFGDNYIGKKDSKYGVINTSNDVKVDFIYDSLAYVSSADFLKATKKGEETRILDRNFNVKITGTISEINTDRGYIRVRTSGGEYKYYNFNFEEKPGKDILTGNTLFLVKKNGKYGYENKKGELIVDYIYDDAMEQNKYGFCSVKKDGKWGCLKSDGAIVVNPSVKLDESLYVDFIGNWHLHEAFDLDLNTYTK